MRKWSFLRCGKDGRAEGDYGIEYEYAATEGVARASGGAFDAEFMRDADLPPRLRRRGWFGLLNFYNPDIRFGNEDGAIYVSGLDTVFLRDLGWLADELDAVGKDIVGCPCFVDGKFNDYVLRIQRGSQGARQIWDRVLEQNYKIVDKMEHRFIRKAGAPHYGMIAPNQSVLSYKVQIGKWKKYFGKQGPLENAKVIAFHGHPRPHEVKETDSLYDLIAANWRPGIIAS